MREDGAAQKDTVQTDAVQTETAHKDAVQNSRPLMDMARTAGAAVRDEEAVRRLVERLALIFAEWGFPRMAGRVLFALMAADEPGLTATELATGLDASPAAISGAVRYLLQLGLVQREAVPGSRRDRYRLPDDTWYATVTTKARFYDVIIAAVDEAMAGLGGPTTPAGARVTEMRDFFDFVRGEMPGLLGRWQASRQSRNGEDRPGPG